MALDTAPGTAPPGSGAPGPATPDPTTRGPRRRTRSAAGLVFVAPAVTFVAGIVYFSVGYTIRVSTLDWDGVGPDPVGVGLANYDRILNDPFFWASLRHMVVFSATILIQLVLGFLLAVLLHSQVRWKSLYKTVVFLPVVLSPAVMAPIFRQILDADGEVNGALQWLRLGDLAHPWLADPGTALYALMAINVWQWTGFSFLLYYAGLTQIESEVLEAARLDGASSLRILARIVLPLMRGTTLTLVILGVIGVVKTFDIPFLVTGGGPARSTEFLATYMYQQGITNFHAGYGAALTMVLVALSLCLTVWQVRRYRTGDR